MPSTVASGRSRTTTDSPSCPYASTPWVCANAYGMRATSAGSNEAATVAEALIGVSMTDSAPGYFAAGGAGLGATPGPGGNGTAMPCIAGSGVSSGAVVSGQNQRG